MQVTELKKEGLSHEYEVTVPASDLDQKVDAKLEQYKGQIRLPGFRPGKVPLKLLKQKHGRAVLGEVVEEAVQEATSKLIQEQNLRPALQPNIEVKEFDEGKDLVISVGVENLPEFEVADVTGIKIERPVSDVKDNEIEDALKRVSAQRKSSTKIEEDRVAQQGDILVIDFHGRTADDGVEHPGMHAHDHHLELGNETFIPGFEDQLKDKKAGETVEVKVTFPEDYGAQELAGREAVFDVDVKEIREPSEAEIDDAFAQSLGLEDLEALRNAIKEQLEQEYGQYSRMKVKKAVLDELDEKHDFEVPERMVDMEHEQIIRQIQAEQQQNGQEEELSQEEKDELRDIAVRRVKLGLVLSEIGRQNNIQVTDQELQQSVIREAQKYPGQEKQVFDYYSKNQNALESLRAPLFEEKTIDYILELAEIEEKKVSVDELMAEEDEESSKKPKEPAKKSSSKKGSEDKETKSQKAETKQEKSSKAASTSKKSAAKKSSSGSKEAQ